MVELKVEAVMSNLHQVQGFLEETLERYGVGARTMMQIAVATEEIFANIVHYAYPNGGGLVTIRFEVTEDECMRILFEDQGLPYNPLEHKDPDFTIAPENRPIGGLGLFMVKQSMDDVKYAYKDNCNILIITKSLNDPLPQY